MRHLEVMYADGSKEKFSCDDVQLTASGTLVLIREMLGKVTIAQAFSPMQWRSMRAIEPPALLT